MKILTQDLVLLFYDVPQVFLARDQIGCRYVCMIGNDDTDSGPIYSCVAISAARADMLTSGKLDLRSVFEAPELSEFYLAHFSTGDDRTLAAKQAEYAIFPANSLPGEGLVFNEFDEVAQAAAELNTTVSFVSLDVPEAAQSARIRSATLGGFLFLFQAIVRNLSRSVARTAKRPLKRDDDSFAADVFGFAQGSFKIKFRSAYPSDITGESPVFTIAMAEVQKFLALADNPAKAIEYLQAVKGHTASSLIKLLGFLSEHAAGIHMEWATPSMSSAYGSRLELDNIRQLFEMCRLRTDLTVQEVILRGRVDLAAHKAGSWKIISEEDQESYSGEILPGSPISLSGMIITNAVYEFTCEEHIETVPATGREIRRLLLKNYKKVAD
ncbi:DUF6575 domain-containing protein [Duganella sp. Root336D2]|uniref:DUF6575 domain-containing protein n=1 Tax=Duganella sp. Root336D2 TaxID=1736518 RepID=UPI0006FB4CF4|nr:DUF6575 domain-containing protein [Duganella sp. Root336D2]KQV44898.1 hypothetical protein ASD07_20365 [Duganella sp. Root336D2]